MKPTSKNANQIDDSIQGLQARRVELISRRNSLQQRLSMIIPIAWIAPFLGPVLGWWFYKTWDNSVLSVFPIIYGFLPIAVTPPLRLRLRQVENDIQEVDFRIDLQQFEVNKRETRAEQLLRLNDFQLRRYYDLNISQNSWVFGLGVFCIILGILIIGATLFLVVRVAQSLETQIITAALGSIGAILTNFIAAIYLKMNSAATENLTSFHSRLVETHQLLLGNLLASRIDNDEKRWETLSQLSLRLMQKDKD